MVASSIKARLLELTFCAITTPWTLATPAPPADSAPEPTSSEVRERISNSPSTFTTALSSIYASAVLLTKITPTVAPTVATPDPPIAAAAKTVLLVSSASIVRSSPARTIAPFSINACVLLRDNPEFVASKVDPSWL